MIGVKIKIFVLMVSCLLCGLCGATDLSGFAGNKYYETKEEAMKVAGADVYDTPRNRSFNDFTTANYARVRALLGSKYAGGWTEYADDGNLYQVIAITGPIQIDKAVFHGDYYKFIYMKYSCEDLELVKNRVDSIFMTPSNGMSDALIHGVTIDPKLNKVSVFVLQKNETRVYDELRRAGLNLEMINVQVQDQMQRPVLKHHDGKRC